MRSKFGAGVVGGLIAGLVFGAIMQMMTTPTSMGGRMPMLAMMAQVVRSDSSVVGWIYVLVNSAVFGGIFGYVLGGRAARMGSGLAWGALYGVLLWLLGALILMPMLLGMAAFAPLTMAPMRPGALVSLMAHLLSGLILGGVFAGLYRGELVASQPITGPGPGDPQH